MSMAARITAVFWESRFVGKNKTDSYDATMISTAAKEQVMTKK
jgi:hypothetical protein